MSSVDENIVAAVSRAAKRCLLLENAQAARFKVCLATGETNMKRQIMRSVICSEMREQLLCTKVRYIGRAYALTFARATAHTPTGTPKL